MHRVAERQVTYLWPTIALALIAGLAITLSASQSEAKARTRTATTAKPTVVLVNGAWANSAGVLGLDSTKPGSALGAGPTKVFNFVPFPGARKGDALLYVKPSVFEHAFANGLPAREGAVLAATQAPVTYSAVTAPSGTPAWKTIPSWYVLGTIDEAIPPAIQLFMARRIHAHITRVRAGHLSMVAAPGAVAKVITAAAKATS
jgi:pimeloyl-ACP methyl ester carboxylesterase